ncbi:MAG: methyltransferase, partial [Pseudomonadota bacterium]|nr:methyltransferase [Pseudomonadota bacterium]
GDPYAKLAYELSNFDVSLEFGPNEFIQVNSEMNHLLIAAVLKGLDLESEDRVVDLFCGIGNFSLPIARTAKSVLGFEISEAAVAQARRNAERNNLSKMARFLVSDLYRPTDNEVAKTDYKMLLDPPRSGAGPELPRFANRARRVAYVSCNPTTFAQDAAVLDQIGFQLESVQVFDMFPHTNHVEVVGSFGRL